MYIKPLETGQHLPNKLANNLRVSALGLTTTYCLDIILYS